MRELQLQFHQDMIHIYKTAKKECGYNANRFLQMISERGGVEAAKQLIQKPTAGFSALAGFQRLDLTVENYVLKPQYHELFSDEERRICRERLREYGFEI